MQNNQQLKTVTNLLTAAPVITGVLCVAISFNASAQTSFPGAFAGQTAPVASSVPLAQPAEAKVVYRDPANQLTIEEMSRIFGEKAKEDFYRKNGFTKDKPPPKVVIKASTPPPVLVPMTVAALYANTNSAWAELRVNQSLVRVAAGQRLTRLISVKQVTGSSLVLSEYPQVFLACQKRPKMKKCNSIQPKDVRLAAGQTYSWVE